jgi:Calcineurin-like phosphoesterase
MKFLRTIILLVVFLAAGVFSARANSSYLSPSQARKATSTPRSTDTKVQTPTRTPTRTRTVTLGPSNTPTLTKTPTLTPSPSSTRTASPTFTVTLTPTFTRTSTLTPYPSSTRTASPTFTVTLTPTITNTVSPGVSFSFASISDSHAQVSPVTQTINQIKALSPKFLIHNGDYENDGVVSSEWNSMTTALNNAGLFNYAFIVRGNHDDHVSGSSSLWQTIFTNYFGTANRPLPAGVSNYVAIAANSTYLTYSYDYGNSRFIAMDVPGDADLITSAEYTFLNNRLTEAENLGLTHAFIYFHGPEYCVEDTHCTCTAKNDSSCTPSAFITIVNNHPIVSATFHGHEHVLGHVHMDNTRIASLTHPYEEFFTSSAGMPYGFTMFPNRIDDNYSSSSLMSFALITVNGLDFTVSFYHTGTTSPVWSKTFTK